MTYSEGDRVRLIRPIAEYRRGDADLPIGTTATVLRGDLFGGRFIQIQVEGEPIVRLVEVEDIEHD